MKFIVVSPDKGGTSRSEKFAKDAKLPIIYLEKHRSKETGKVSVTDISGDVKDASAIIFDDIINTGATAVETSAFLKNNGAKDVLFIATHAVFAGNASELLAKSKINRVIVTNTIDISKQKQFDSLTIVSVSSLLADAIKQNLG